MSINSLWWFEDIESSKISENIWENQERAKKTQFQLKKIQKDENFAKEDNQKLFLILSRFINNPYYESLVSEVSGLLSIPLPSRFIIVLIALFHPDAAYFVLDVVGRKEKINSLLSLPQFSSQQYFDEKNIHPELQKWLTEWITSMELFLIHSTSSLLMQKKILQLSDEEKNKTQKTITEFLKFFFLTRNIFISEDKAKEYTNFIFQNINKIIKKNISLHNDNMNTLLEDITLSSNDFFAS